MPETEAVGGTLDTAKIAAIYQALDTGQREIRLMRLQHSEDHHIICELNVISLEERPVYTALSYAWTTQPATHEIMLNGVPFFIRPNLYEYLRVMQVEDNPRWIFIDALCINQADSVEKASQISMMYSIFSEAEDVVAWLGVQVDETGSDNDVRHWISALQHEEKEGLKQISEAAIDNAHRYAGWVVGAVVAFFPWSYWSRLWITQEVLLARNLVLRFGDLHMTAEVALHLLTRAHGKSLVKSLVARPTLADPQRTDLSLHGRAEILACYFLAQHLARRTTDPPVYTLPSVIVTLAGQQCTERYDTIFGLLGVAQSVLIPSYSMPLMELYLRVLIEGLLLLRPVMFRSSWDQPTKSLNYFIRNLLFGLGLDSSHPVVFLTSSRCLRLACGWRFEYITYWDRSVLARPSAPSLWKVPLAILNDTKQYVSIRLLLRRCLAEGRELAGPHGDGSSRTPGEWNDFVDDIYQGVQRQLQP